MRIFRKLAQLLDVAIVDPQDGDGFSYSASSGKWENAAGGGGGGAPTDVNYLVGTADSGLSAEIVVGTSPGGELGGTWASPTVDATHSGSSHASVQAAAEATAAAALSAHASDTTGVHGIADTSALLDTGDIGSTVQAYDADLSTWAGLTPSANAQSLVTAANYAAMRTLLGLVIGTNVQAYDADLTTWAGLTPSSFFQTLVDDADAATARATLGVIASLFQSGGAQAIKLDDLAAPDDNTDLNVSTSAHGLAPKSPNDATKYLDGTGAYSVPAGGGGGGYTLMDYTAKTTDVVFDGTETTVVTSGSFTADGTSKYRIEFFCALVALFNNASNINLREDPAGSNTDLGIMAQLSDANTQDALTVSTIVTPSAGSHAYRITARRTAGTGAPQLTATGYRPMYIMITKLA